MTKLSIGGRLCFKDDLCTVRYIGEVAGKQGQWLGVEWDYPSRGKHCGVFENRQYFSCRSDGPTCASFLRPDAKFASRQTIRQALTSKYASADSSAHMPAVSISGKTIEETGYDKIVAQQSNLASLKTVILDHQRLGAIPNQPPVSLDQLCPQAIKVDLGYNVFESLDDVAESIGQANSLRNLSLEQLSSLLKSFPSIKQLSASSNVLAREQACDFPPGLIELELNDNGFVDLQSVATRVRSCKQLRSISVKHNKISQLYKTSLQTPNLPAFPSDLEEIDLSYNDINSWDFFDCITAIAPGLSHLRITGNLIYEACTTPKGKPIHPTQISMLVVARIGQLKMLNFTPIADKDRLNAETFYLSLIAEELSLAPVEAEDEILSRHPRYAELCEEYGQPSVVRAGATSVDPNSIAAHLIRGRIYVSGDEAAADWPTKDDPWLVELPQTFSMYSVFAAIGRRLGVPAASLRLTWETGERDPPDRGIATHATVIEEWDSEDEEEGPSADTWVDREIELEVGTRPLVTMIDKAEARIRVEIRHL